MRKFPRNFSGRTAIAGGRPPGSPSARPPAPRPFGSPPPVPGFQPRPFSGAFTAFFPSFRGRGARPVLFMV
ncbi:MAG: hypothetical protein C6P37_06290 [Caldibacillus debilis]|uniref:Uncharacterized protein n=1 Tax=Caldibacillus debilis TaxID=301148 RepID=A0A3E0K612_9BACI|nr:MAG: hypothetical protein C6W57_11565 [Caldibacillus debilis]REJ29545.1 MAG: hypothetical protein C6P37_06290 [Caldibacillus debilis]